MENGMHAHVKLNPSLFCDDWEGGFKPNYYKTVNMENGMHVHVKLTPLVYSMIYYYYLQKMGEAD